MTQFPIPILTYHSIDDSGSVISTSPEVFRRQMECLHSLNCKAISLKEFARVINEGAGLPRRTVVLTFDDGFRNFAAEAFPVLRRYGFQATVFLVTDYCGRDNYWPTQPQGVARMPLLSWEEITELHRAGVEFGSHTATHPDLAVIPPDEAAREMRRSKAELAHRLGEEAATFAYPYGSYSAEVSEIARKEFVASVTAALGRADEACVMHLLKRIEMYYFANLTLFRAMITGRAGWYLNFRKTLRSVKTALR